MLNPFYKLFPAWWNKALFNQNSRVWVAPCYRTALWAMELLGNDHLSHGSSPRFKSLALLAFAQKLSLGESACTNLVYLLWRKNHHSGKESYIFKLGILRNGPYILRWKWWCPQDRYQFWWYVYIRKSSDYFEPTAVLLSLWHMVVGVLTLDLPFSFNTLFLFVSIWKWPLQMLLQKLLPPQRKRLGHDLKN